MTDPRENDRISDQPHDPDATASGPGDAAAATAAPAGVRGDAAGRRAPATSAGTPLGRALSGALVAAGVSAILGLLFSVLTLFSANQPGAAVLVTLLDYWTVHPRSSRSCSSRPSPGPGMYRRLWTTIVGSVAAGVLGALVGSLIGALGQGATVTGDIVGPLLETLLGLNLMFVIGVSLASILLGRRLWIRLVREDAATARERVALVRIPSSRLADGASSRTASASPVDAELADQQWERYVLALEEHGLVDPRGPAGGRPRGLRLRRGRGRRARRHRRGAHLRCGVPSWRADRRRGGAGRHAPRGRLHRPARHHRRAVTSLKWAAPSTSVPANGPTPPGSGVCARSRGPSATPSSPCPSAGPSTSSRR
ncbi:hypothetical protein [Clavibacter zhangzhiyongii]|uniref:hypothetical protein n=1 Tax=Clavibacter zhangzhiyongii TaxID=2768071 RepID=UPI0039E1D559